MSLSLQAADLITQTKLRLRALRDTARRLRPGSRHSISARFLLNLCGTALSGLFQRLNTRPDDDLADVERNVKAVKQCADFIHLLLGFATEPSVGRVPQAMAAPLQRLAAGLAERNRVLIYYDWRPSNYSFRREFPERLQNVLLQALVEDVDAPECEWPEAVKAVPPVFAVLSLPAAEQDHVLLHSALGHEVGHALAERLTPDPPGLAPYELNRIAWNWQQELLADAWGVFLLGPAPLLSLIDLASQHAASETHPCSYLRFTVMADCLRKSGFLDISHPPEDLQWLALHIDRALEKAKLSQPRNGDDPHFAEAHCYLSAQRTVIVDFVFSHPGAYQRSTWDDEVALGSGRHPLVSRILHCAPPDRIDPPGQEPRLGSILNAGWAVRKDPQTWQAFSFQFDLHDSEREYRSLKRLNQLLLKAIEITSIERAWREAAL